MSTEPSHQDIIATNTDRLLTLLAEIRDELRALRRLVLGDCVDENAGQD